MADVNWPSSIKPLTNKNYSLARGSNVQNSTVQGGLPRIATDYTLEPVQFSLNFTLSGLQMQVMMNFYDAALNHGGNKFLMNLDSGNGIEEHECFIVPNTWKMSAPANSVWYLACSVIAEVTSSQLNDCSNISELYNCYGDEIWNIIAGLEDFVLELPSV